VTARRPPRSEYETLRPRLTLQRRDDGSYADDQPRRPRQYPHHTGEPTGGDCNTSGLRFKKGNQLGRPKGRTNYVTALMKASILEAAGSSKRAGRNGLVAYLRHCADEFPTHYMRLLARLIPHDLRFQLRAELTERTDTPEQIKAKLAARGINIDHIFERPQIPSPGQRLQPRPTPPPHEDRLDREPEGLSATNNPPRPVNPYSIHRKAEPAHVGPPLEGEQLSFPWPSKVPPENCAWAERRPLRVVASNNPEELIDDQERAPPPAAE
jgi:hypothetical protein